MLETRFPRVLGDAGNPESWPFDVDLEIVRGVGAEAAVRGADVLNQEPLFVDAARRLENRGASLITTSCGFLILFQAALQAATRVPVLTSSLLAVPLVASVLQPKKKIAILTFEERSLGERHLAAAGIDPERVIVAGMDGTAFHATISQDLETLDVERARIDHVARAKEVTSEHPAVAAFVLECTNMPPYASAIRNATGLPVYDITILIRSLASGFMGTT